LRIDITVMPAGIKQDSDVRCLSGVLPEMPVFPIPVQCLDEKTEEGNVKDKDGTQG
jgi:hypothetical protein